MENAADALKIALGIFIFLVGLVLLFNMASLSKETSRVLISEIDKVKYYDFYKDATEEKIDKNGNRIVELKDIIPAIYRYSEENFGVTIVDKQGNIVARFDLDTEAACNNWITMKPYFKYSFVSETRKIYEEVNDIAKKNIVKINQIYINISPNNPNKDSDITVNDESAMISFFNNLYGQDKNEYVRRDYYCYWIGSAGWTSQRIDSDLSRN